jgi:hypothetical protein
MKRRAFTALASTTALVSLNSSAQKIKRPNLLFIMTDQQRFDALSLAGNKILKMPNMDRIGKEGAYF